jgi:hypothetical protein
VVAVTYSVFGVHEFFAGGFHLSRAQVELHVQIEQVSHLLLAFPVLGLWEKVLHEHDFAETRGHFLAFFAEVMGSISSKLFGLIFLHLF